MFVNVFLHEYVLYVKFMNQVCVPHIHGKCRVQAEIDQIVVYSVEVPVPVSTCIMSHVILKCSMHRQSFLLEPLIQSLKQCGKTDIDAPHDTYEIIAGSNI